MAESPLCPEDQCKRLQKTKCNRCIKNRKDAVEMLREQGGLEVGKMSPLAEYLRHVPYVDPEQECAIREEHF